MESTSSTSSAEEGRALGVINRATIAAALLSQTAMRASGRGMKACLLGYLRWRQSRALAVESPWDDPASLQRSAPYGLHFQTPRIDVTKNQFQGIASPEVSVDVSELLVDGEVEQLWEPISPPTLRSKVYHKLDKVEVEVERPKSIQRARTSRAPTPADPLNALFMLLAPEVQWDFRLENPATLLTAYPPGKQPYGFQKEGIVFLVENRTALLADEMGLGKTVQAVLALRALVHKDPQVRALCVVPKSLLQSWEDTFREWAPELHTVVVQGDRQVREAIAKRVYHVYITNYEAVQRTYCESHERRASKTFEPQDWVPIFDQIIVDEAQNYKNLSTQKARAFRTLERRGCWALTGTPIENRSSDVAAIWDVIDPGLRYSAMKESEFRHSTLSRTRRRLKSDEGVDLDLPEFTSKNERLNLETKQAKSYRALEGRMKGKAEAIKGKVADGSITAAQAKMSVLEVISKLKQCCVYDVHSKASAKLEWLKTHLETIQNSEIPGKPKEKVLVFTQFPNLLTDQWSFERELQAYNPVVYSGKLTDRQRKNVIQQIQEDESTKVAFLSLRAAGTGLTLTRANHIVFLDAWWNPAVMQQAQARIHRIGQDRKCYIWNLVCNNTIEERIQNMLRQKAAELANYTQKLREDQKDLLEEFDEKAFENVVSLQDMLDVIGI